MTSLAQASTGGFAATPEADDEATAQDFAEGWETPEQSLATGQKLFPAGHNYDI